MLQGTIRFTLLFFTLLITQTTTATTTETVTVDFNVPDLTVLSYDSPVQTTEHDSTAYDNMIGDYPPTMIPDPDGQNWHIIKGYRRAYWWEQRIVTINSKTGNIDIQNLSTAGESWHMHDGVIANGKLFINVLANPGIIQRVHTYNPATEIWSFNAITIPSHFQGLSHPMQLGTDNLIVCAGTYNNGDGTSYPTCATINPQTLEFIEYGKIGAIDYNQYLAVAYGYSVGADNTHIYVAAGKYQWQLIAVRKSDGQQTTLLTTPPGAGGISIYQGRHGVIAYGSGLNGGYPNGYYVVQNGMLGSSASNPESIVDPFGPGTTFNFDENKENESLPPLPEIDFSSSETGDADNTIWFRRAADSSLSGGITPEDDGWERFDFTVPVYEQYIHNMYMLGNGNLFVAGDNYAGYALFNPADNTGEHLGQTPNISPYDMIQHPNGKLYFTGYAGSPLYEYDPALPWTQNLGTGDDPRDLPLDYADPSHNPRFIGQLSAESGAKKSYAIAVANNKVYAGGNWIREGDRGGLAWYDPATGQADGTWEPFRTYRIRDLETIGTKLIISTVATPDDLLQLPTPTSGKIMVWDTVSDTLLSTIDAVPESEHTGYITAVDDDHIMGITTNYPTETFIYKVNINTGVVVFRKRIMTTTETYKGYNLDIKIGMKKLHDGNVYVFMNSNTLCKVDLGGNITPIGNAYRGDIIASDTDLFIASLDSVRKIENILPSPLAENFIPVGHWLLNGYVRCITQEDVDHEFNIRIHGTITSTNSQVKVIAPNGQIVVSQLLPPQEYKDYRITVPSDGQTGQYVVFLKSTDGKDMLYPPLTSLPKEVYAALWISQLQGSSRFIGSDGDPLYQVTATGHKSTVVITDTADNILGASTFNNPVTVTIPLTGAILTSPARYISFGDIVVFSFKEEQWFLPDVDKKTMLP